MTHKEEIKKLKKKISKIPKTMKKKKFANIHQSYKGFLIKKKIEMEYLVNRMEDYLGLTCEECKKEMINLDGWVPCYPATSCEKDGVLSNIPSHICPECEAKRPKADGTWFTCQSCWNEFASLRI